MFKRFISPQAAAHGESLAQELINRYPLELDKSPGKISAARISRILEGIYDRAKKIHAEEKLGLIGKTRMAHAFKWRLRDAGYSNAFVDLATEGLIVYLHKPAAPAPKLERAERKRARKAERIRERASGDETPRG